MPSLLARTAAIVAASILLASCGGSDDETSPQLSPGANQGQDPDSGAPIPDSGSPSDPAPGTSDSPGTGDPGTGDPGTGDPGTGGQEPEPSSPLAYLPRALDARFAQPTSIASATDGSLYVTDYGTVRRIWPDGRVTTVAGAPAEFGSPPDGGADGPAEQARFNAMKAITVGSDGNLYVADTITNTGRIRRIASDGTVSTVVDDVYALGITADGNGRIYFTDNWTGSVRRLGATGPVAQISEPRGITIDNGGNLYVLNTGLDYGPLGQTTFSCTLERIAPDGTVQTIAGSFAAQEFDNTCGHVDGTGAGAQLGGHSQALAVDQAGNVYFTDTLNHTIRRVTPAGVVTTIAGSPGNPGSSDGSGSSARFFSPRGIAVGRDGNLYVADTGNLTIRRVTPDGEVTTISGKAGESGSTDTAPAPSS